VSKACADDLSLDVWKARMRDLQKDCVASVPREQAARIRDAAHLLGRSELHAVGCAPVSIRMADLEAMLEASAFESAVLHLMGGEAAFMLSRGGNGSCLATVVQPDGAEEMIAEGATPALALLAAHLAALAEDAGADCIVSDPGPAKASSIRLN